MDLLLLSPVKTQKPEQLQLGAPSSMNRVPYQLVNDLQLSENSDIEENFSVEKSEQAVKGSFCLIENMPSLDDSTERPTVHQSSNTKRAEVKQLEPGRMAECNAYDLANDLQLSDDSDLEDNLMKSKGGAEVIQNCGPSSRATHPRDNNEFGAFLPSMQNLQEVPTNTDSGPYSLANDLDLSEDSDSDDDFDAVLPNTVGSCRIENTPSLYNGRLQDTQNFPKEVMSEKIAYEKIERDTAGKRVAPKEMSHTKDQTSGGRKTPLKDSSRNRLGQQYERKPSECQVVPSNPQDSSSPISFRKGYGTSYQTVLQPLVPSTPTQPRQTIIMASGKLVKSAIDPSLKVIAANSDVKAGDRQRIYKLPKQKPQQEITRKSPQKRDHTNSKVVNSFNGRHITKPTKVAAIFSNGQSNKNFNGSSPDEKPPAPSLDPLPENFTLPVARKVRTSTFSKQQIESQISRGKILLQKTAENQSRCEDPAKPRKQTASDQKNGKSAKNIARMSKVPQIKQKTTDETERSLEAKIITPEVNRIIKIDRKEAKQRNEVRGAHKGLLKESSENKANTEDQSKLHKRKAREMLSSSSTSPKDEMSVGNITQVPEQPRKKQKICKDIEKSGEDSSMIKPQTAKDRIADNRQKKLPKGSRSKDKGEASRPQLQKTHTPKSDDKCLKKEQRNPMVAEDCKQDSGLGQMVSDRIPQTAKDGMTDNRQKKLPKGSRSEEKGEASRLQLQKTHTPKGDDKCLKHEQRNPVVAEDCKQDSGLGQMVSDSKPQTAKDRMADNYQKRFPKGTRSKDKGETSRPQLQKTHSPKGDDKCPKNEQKHPITTEDCKQDAGVEQIISDREKFKILRREYIELMESVKKPAHLILELKKVLERKIVSGTEREAMAIKEEILFIGKQLRSESFRNQKRKLKQLEDQLQLLKYNIRNSNGTLEL
ncbi:unnamed protein product [Hermetia illucens]|uniref:Uncharacterized protein n=1 Tax=Hermetia illucens TaxID=343691 RepID=A0A7R8YRG8_HERIL|nr:unnamed protein product [Hermetia illucens]